MRRVYDMRIQYKLTYQTYIIKFLRPGNFFSDSYLGVLRLFLRVLEVARSRRLGIAGEVSVWQIPENSVNHARVNTAATFFLAATFFFFAQHFGRAFSLLEKRSMIDFPIRSY